MGIYKNEPKDMDGFKSKQFSLFLKKKFENAKLVFGK